MNTIKLIVTILVMAWALNVHAAYDIQLPPPGSEGTYPADYFWLNDDVPVTEWVCNDRVDVVRVSTYTLTKPVRGRTNFTRTYMPGYGDGAYDDDYDPNGNRGFFNLPLFEVPINNARNGDCLVIHFSGTARIPDNRLVFQASLDGIPTPGHTKLGLDHFWTYDMYGHKVGLDVPVVILDADWGARTAYVTTYGVYPWTPFSFTFTVRLTRGNHTLRIKWAGCCGNVPYSPNLELIETATLIVSR